MENASKALLMAGGMLIAVAIFSLFAYLFSTMGGYTQRTYSIIETNRINQFNSQFTKYNNRKDLTIQDVVTIANLAKNNNKSYGLDTPSASNYYVAVYLNGNEDSNRIEKKTKPVSDSDFFTGVENSYKYKCTTVISEMTMRVYRVYIVKI